MLIRTQNKRAIVNMNLIHIGLIGGRVIASEQIEYEPEMAMTLGVYSTEEKAIKVLDMIEEAYGRKCASDRIQIDTMVQTIEEMELYGVDRATAINSVTEGCIKVHTFQMPADEEVEE